MSQVTLPSQAGQVNPLEPATPGGPAPSAPGAPQIPPSTASGGSGKVDYAALGIPSLATPSLAGLSLEQLVEAIGGEGRRLALQQGLDAIKAKGDEIKELNAQKMEELKKNLEQLKKKEKLSPFLKAFKWIGLVLGAIASVAGIVAGAVTGNPLLIAGGIIGLTMTVNSIVSEATDGKHGISAWVTELAKKCGASEDAAKWIGFAVEMAIALVGVGLSIGGAVRGFSAAVEITEKMASAMSKVATLAAGASLLSGLNTIAQGSVQIVSATYDYKIAQAKAEMQDLQAILERIQTAMQTETDFVEAVMEKTQELLGKVREIVQDNVTAQTAILTGSPSMA
jgi:hypothetical protein